MADVKPLILNISEKLAGWKARLLSLAGRFQFLKFTVWNTIAYWIRGAVLPKACFNIINRLCAKFLFFGDTEAKKLHLIAWKRTCKPRHLGGLGLPNLHSLSFAYTCSQIFRFYNSKSILSSYLNAIYGTPWTPSLHKESPYWKAVKKVASQISSNVLFYFNSHSKLAMLWDPWINGKSLSMVCLDRNILSYFPHNAKVSDFLDGGAWNLAGLGNNALARFLGSYAYDTDATNNIIWKDKSKATLSTFINQYFCEDSVLEWHKLVWHKHHALKYSIYTWIALNNGLKTADELFKRNIVVSNACSLCYSHSESANHILFECDYSFNVLSKLIPYLGDFLLRPRLMQVLNLLGERPFTLKKQREFYLLIVCCTTYYLWRERNDRSLICSSPGVSCCVFLYWLALLGYGYLAISLSVYSGVLFMLIPGWPFLATSLSPSMDISHGSSLCSTPDLTDCCWMSIPGLVVPVWAGLPSTAMVPTKPTSDMTVGHMLIRLFLAPLLFSVVFGDQIPVTDHDREFLAIDPKKVEGKSIDDAVQEIKDVLKKKKEEIIEAFDPERDCLLDYDEDGTLDADVFVVDTKASSLKNNDRQHDDDEEE
ncbi:hypothetical protein M5K25_027048 [Dendrobium thyrsiflorum]|uniref:Reverse transcriptase zinc-binding domain-containing protein n=1 Tax=Dendrobium thyrsiflorum TaxID=117978 RepID=A0ABD0TZC2_DENTH